MRKLVLVALLVCAIAGLLAGPALAENGTITFSTQARFTKR